MYPNRDKIIELYEKVRSRTINEEEWENLTIFLSHDIPEHLKEDTEKYFKLCEKGAAKNQGDKTLYAFLYAFLLIDDNSQNDIEILEKKTRLLEEVFAITQDPKICNVLGHLYKCSLHQSIPYNPQSIKMWTYGADVLKSGLCSNTLAKSHLWTTEDPDNRKEQVRKGIWYGFQAIRQGKIDDIPFGLDPDTDTTDKVVPYGQWSRQKEIHRWVPDKIKKEMLLVLLMHRRKIFIIPKDVVFIILEYVCTVRN